MKSHNLSRFLVPFSLCVLTFLHTSDSHADWPICRRDAKRTATASNAPAGISQPVPYWRYYLGGTVSPTGHTALDVNGDGKVEVVYIAGGKLLAKLSDDTIVWETPALNLTTLVGVADT